MARRPDSKERKASSARLALLLIAILGLAAFALICDAAAWLASPIRKAR